MGVLSMRVHTGQSASSEGFLAGEYGVPSGRSTLHSAEEYVCAPMCIVSHAPCSDVVVVNAMS